MNSEPKRAYLQVRNLTKKYGDFVALDDISLDIFENEFVCFLGPSGCGKTTLLRAIAGLDIQTYGSISQAGKDISSLPPSERDFGIVFQSYALFPNLSVGKNVSVGLENMRLPARDIQARTTELLSLVGLLDQSDKFPAQLSGGQQQRVALARAMAMSPGLLLLDEPLSALDAKVRSRLRREIKDLQRKFAVTTIMVTHDQEEALTMADRIVVMDNGVIEQVGSPEDIYGSPKTEFVADFVGTMNFLPGQIDGQDSVRIGDVVLTCGTDSIAIGSAVTVAIRPEDVNARDNSNEDQNVVQADVLELEFLGSFCRAKLGGGDLGDINLQADLSINLVRDHAIEVGTKLRVKLPADFLRLYLKD